MQPRGQVPLLAFAQVPLPHTHCPFWQHADFLPCAAQHVPSGQQMALAAAVPHEYCPVPQLAGLAAATAAEAPPPPPVTPAVTPAAPTAVALTIAAVFDDELVPRPGGHREQPLGHAPPLDAAQVPLLHTHWPALQQLDRVPRLAQHWLGLQHWLLALLLAPQRTFGAGQAGACALARAAAPTMAAVSALPSSRIARRRGIGVARIRAA